MVRSRSISGCGLMNQLLQGCCRSHSIREDMYQGALPSGHFLSYESITRQFASKPRVTTSDSTSQHSDSARDDRADLAERIIQVSSTTRAGTDLTRWEL